MSRSRGGSFAVQPRLDAFPSGALHPLGPRPRRRHRRRLPSIHELHEPNPVDPAFCLHCGFAWPGHPDYIRVAAAVRGP